MRLQQPADDDRQTHPHEQRRGIRQPTAQVLDRGREHESHGYSRSSRPVSLMNKLSRLGWLSDVSCSSPPAASIAVKIADSRRVAPSTASRSVRSSTDTTSMPPRLFQRAPRRLRVKSSREPQHVPLADELPQLVERAHRQQLAVIDDRDAVAEVLRLFHVVRGVEHARARRDLLAHESREMASRLCGSTPTVGSSRSSTFGSCTTPQPKFSRRFMPPLNRLTGSRARSPRPMRSSTSSTASLQPRRRSGRTAAPQYARFSRALRSS